MDGNAADTNPPQVRQRFGDELTRNLGRGETSSDSLALARLAEAIVLHANVWDCAAIERATVGGEFEVVAYVVPFSECSDEQLREHLRARRPAVTPPDVFVFVSSLPLTEEGKPDFDVLSGVSVVDSELIESVDRRLSSETPRAVVIAESVEESVPLHLADIMPRWSRGVSDATPIPDSDEIVPVDQPGHSTTAKLAVASGDPLRARADAPETLQDAMRSTARNAESRGLVYINPDGHESSQTYSALVGEAECVLSGFRSIGLVAGDCVLLQLERHPDFLAGFWACVLGGMIPVPLAVPASYQQPASLKSLEGAYSVVGRPFVLTSRRRRDELENAAEVLGLEGFRAGAIEDLRRDELDSPWHKSQPDELALLMLTSGSTGAPKAVMLSHRNLLTRTKGSEQLNEFTRDDVSLNWMPLDHVAGLIYFHIRDVYLGCRQIQVPTESVLRDPLLWLDCIDRFRVTITFAPNFAYALVNELHEEVRAREWNLSSVRFLLNGAEAIVARTARQFLRLLEPHGLQPTCMHPAWGMSETSSGVTYSDRFNLQSTTDDDPFVVVGRPIPGISMRIVDDDDAVVVEGHVGHLQVRGLVVTKSYYHNPQGTRDAFTADGWFDTGDLATIRDGYVTIAGREKDVVVINSVKYYSHAIESEVEDIEGVVTSYTAACAVRDPVHDTDQLAIFFNPMSFERAALTDLLRRIRATVGSRIGIRPDFLVPVPAERIPKTSLGKIQRTELASKLLAGEFEDALRMADIATRTNTIPAWFYRKVWQRQELRPGGRLSAGATLIFMDDAGLGDALRDELVASDNDCVTVSWGPSYECAGSRSYRIDPLEQENYARLFSALSVEGLEIRQVVHLCGYAALDGEGPEGGTSEPDASASLASLLYLTHALAEVQGETPTIRVAVVGSHAARLEASDAVACERAPMVGWVRSIPQELPWLQCAYVDVPFGMQEAPRLVRREIEAASPEREVAYRAGGRFVARLEQAALGAESRRELPFEKGDMVLVVGGLGGIGFHLSRYLLVELSCRLLLVGKSALEPSSARAESFAVLRDLSEDVAYEPADVVDLPALSDLVSRHESRWHTKLSAAVHLAGDYRERLAVEETCESFEELLAPRALGTRNLHRILEQRGSGTLILSSSVASFFGGASVGAYAAANRFLDAFAEHYSGRGAVRVYSFQWSNWDDVGQARRNLSKDLPRSRGYMAMPAGDGLRSFIIGLSHEGASLLVGLDGDNRHVRSYVTSRVDGLHEVRLYCLEAEAEARRAEVAGLELQDRFGVPVACRVVPLEQIPLTPAGEVDRTELAELSRAQSRGGQAGGEPDTDTEIRLASIWETVLGVSGVKRGDSFFELGGDSLMAVRAQSQIRDGFGIELSLRTLFELTRLVDLACEIQGRASLAEPQREVGEERGLEDPEALLERLDDMTDEEVDALLTQVTEDDEGGT